MAISHGPESPLPFLSQKSILERLASVVAALPAAHVPRILKQLPSMVRSGVGKQSTISLELLISGWEGLEAAIHWGPEIGKKVYIGFSCLPSIHNGTSLI